MVKLKDICTINPKATILVDDLEVSFVPMPKVGEQGEFDPSEIRTYQEVKKGFTNFQNGDVLFAKITPCMENGKGAIAKSLRNGYGFGSTEFHVLRPDNSKVTSEWLYYLTSWSEFRKDAENNMTGSAGQKRVPKTFLENYDVNLPELQRQKEIATILDHIGEMIALRKEQLTKLDQLVKSRFIELFGDRYINDKKWDNKPLYECADFYNGKAHEQVVDENGEYILVTSRCIASDISDYRRTNALLFPLQVNDIAMVMSDVPNGRALAKCVLIDEDGKYTLNQRICCLRNYSFNPIFFYYLLNRHEYFLSFNDGNAQTNLRKDDLLACNIIIPPMELQEQFAAFVEQTDKSKLAIQQSLDKLELLKKSLMQEYFG